MIRDNYTFFIIHYSLKNMLINFSNHPSDKWDEMQKQTALSQFGSIVDLQFPQVDPQANESGIRELANQYVQRIKEMLTLQENKFPVAVHIMGEMTFLFCVINLLKNNEIQCLASTTQRKAIVDDKGVKTSVFEFVRFRNY